MSKQQFARFTFLIDPDLKKRFEYACALRDITASQMLRQMIKSHIAARESRAPLRQRDR